MKNILFTALLAMLGTGAFAQTAAGTVSFSGSLDVVPGQHASPDANAVLYNHGLSISPSVGYFIANQLELGITASVNSSSQNNDVTYSDRKTKNSNSSLSYSVGPYLRKYFMLTDKVALHGTADLYYEGTNYKSASDITYNDPAMMPEERESIQRNNAFGLSISPGVSFFASNKIGLGASFGSLGYSHSTSKVDENTSTNKYNTFGFNLNAALFELNFSYYRSR